MPAFANSAAAHVMPARPLPRVKARAGHARVPCVHGARSARPALRQRKCVAARATMEQENKEMAAAEARWDAQVRLTLFKRQRLVVLCGRRGGQYCCSAVRRRPVIPLICTVPLRSPCHDLRTTPLPHITFDARACVWRGRRAKQPCFRAHSEHRDASSARTPLRPLTARSPCSCATAS